MRPLPGRLVLLGHPVAHSRSPRIQNAALRAAGIPLVYELLDVGAEAVAGTVRSLRAVRAAGNVTIPHKAAVARECDRLMPLAERTGAVNTFWTEGDRLVGDNTDVEGFEDAVRALLGRLPSGADVALFGAGGAAAAVLAAIERWDGCRPRLYNRTAARAEALVARFPGVVVAPTPAEALAGASLAVNATSLGMHDDATPFAVDLLAPGASVLDLVYRPGESALVRAARAAGHPAAGGLRMLVGQGARAFERWFGMVPNRELMWRAAQDAS